jgi:hypothetical protein
LKLGGPLLAGAVLLSTTAALTVAPDRGAFVRIDASGCPSGPRRGSGFVWRDAGSVVTALHVVAGCTSLGVRYPVQGGQFRTAKLVRLVQRYDLALLEVATPVQVVPLTAATTNPPPDEAMTAWGYPVLVRGLIDTRLRRRETEGRLSDLLNEQLRQEVSAAGMPDPSTEVLLLDGGHLLPGHSGGALVDSSGRVVAIADGGLERGASEVNWAIPATRLQDLLASSETSVTNPRAVATLYAAELVEPEDTATFDMAAGKGPSPAPATTRTAYECGVGTLVKTRNRSLRELARSSDDQLGLQQLLAASTGFVRDTDRFDVYQEIRTGATVVVPEGASLSRVDQLCVSRGRIASVRQFVEITAAATPVDIQAASVAYEQRLVQLLGAGVWQADPAWTYVTPLVRFDGLVARRKGNAKFVASPGSPSGFVADTYAFETLVAKGGFFVGVTAVRSGFSVQKLQQQHQCLAMPGLAPCEVIRAELREVALANIATLLSTFPTA